MVGYGKVSETSKIWEPGNRIVDSCNATFSGTVPVKPATVDNVEHAEYSDNFLNSSTSLYYGQPRRKKEDDSGAKVVMTKTKVGAAIPIMRRTIIPTMKFHYMIQ